MKQDALDEGQEHDGVLSWLYYVYVCLCMFMYVKVCLRVFVYVYVENWITRREDRTILNIGMATEWLDRCWRKDL